MPKKASIKRLVISVPRNLDEAADFLSFIGKERRKIEEIRSALNEKIEELKVKAMADVRLHNEKIDQFVEGLFAFAESNRDKLTNGNKHKTVELPTGIFAWRMTPPAVSIHNTKSVLAKLKELGLHRFIRVKETILKEPEAVRAIKGISISQHEEFIVKPTELEVEIISNVKKLKKTITNLQ